MKNFISRIYKTSIVGCVDAIYNEKDLGKDLGIETKFFYWLHTTTYFGMFVRRSYTVIGESRWNAKEHRRFGSVVYPWLKTGILHLTYHWPKPTKLELESYFITHGDEYLIGTPTP